MTNLEWFTEPEQHNYPAAQDYLTLIFDPKKAAMLVARLRKADVVEFMAKDILRASKLPLLGTDNAHVQRVLKKVKDKLQLSPILLVRGEGKCFIADGYHRLCGVYHIDENAEMKVKII